MFLSLSTTNKNTFKDKIIVFHTKSNGTNLTKREATEVSRGTLRGSIYSKSKAPEPFPQNTHFRACS